MTSAAGSGQATHLFRGRAGCSTKCVGVPMTHYIALRVRLAIGVPSRPIAQEKLTFMNTTKKWLIGAVSAVVALVALFYFFDWNLLRGYVERRVGQATGRALKIGQLDVKLSWHPSVIVDGVALSNAAWSSEPMMVELKHAEITLDLLSLFTRHINIRSVQLREPNIVLESSDKGVGNWVFAKDSSSNSRTVTVQHLDIDHGSVLYRSPTDKIDLKVEVSSEPDTDTSKRRLNVHANGTYRALDTDVKGEVGAITGLADLESSYPIKLSGNVGNTRASAQGTVAKPLQLEGLNAEFELSGDSLAELFPLVGVPLPPTPRYAVSGRLAQSGGMWNVKQFKGKVGKSDVAGEFSIDRGQLPQFIKANLQSTNLDLKDLSGALGARTEQGEKIVRPSGRLLPDDPFNVEKLHAANADVQFKGKHIQTQRWPIDNMTMHLKLNDGKLVLDPVNLGVASGAIDATINMNANSTPIETSADIKLKNIRFDQLFPGFKLEKANAGVIGGRAQLATKGDSFAKMLGSANGQVAFMMYGGSVSKLALRLANLDVANSIVAVLGGNKSVPIRCMVTDMKADDGNMTITTMVLDTKKSALKGKGSISFKDETLDLKLEAVPKDISLVAFRGPIDVTGTFKNPRTTPELKKVGGRVALATLLGSLASPLAFIPLLEFGGGEDSDCAALLREAEENSKKQPVKPEA